jgi:hypothetical protein
MKEGWQMLKTGKGIHPKPIVCFGLTVYPKELRRQAR